MDERPTNFEESSTKMVGGMASSRNQPMDSGKPPSPSLSSTLSLDTSEASESSMREPFSGSTRTKIRSACHNRCVICLRSLGVTGQSAHILDAADQGGNMVDYGTAVGILAPNYKRSAAENGVFLCSSCHQDLFTPKHVIFSPHREVLRYLIEFIRARNSRPVHEVLHSLVSSPPPYPDFVVPNPQTVLPFLGLYTLVALEPRKLENVDFHVYMEAEVSELSDGHWATIPSDVTPSSPTTARIYDATSLPPTNQNPGCDIRLSDMPNNEPRYWRLPTDISPILTYLLYSVANLSGSNTEEVRLAIELHSLLALRSLEIQGSLSDPDVGGGSPDVGNKRGHDRHPGGSVACKRRRRTTSHLSEGDDGSVQSDELRFSSEMTSHEIIFAARGIILY